MVFAFPLIPLVEAPMGKFVILSLGDSLYFVSASLATHPYHANIVYSFLQEGGRAHAALTSPMHCDINTPGWKVLGGGRYELFTGSKVFHLSDKSTAYGRYPLALVKKNQDALITALNLAGYSLRLS